MATLDGCPAGPLPAPANFNLLLVLAAGELFVSWQCFIDGIDQQLPDETNPGYGVVGAMAGAYDCVGTYTDANGATQTLSCEVTVTAQSHDGCPTEPVDVDTSTTITANHSLAGTVSYEHIINGLSSSQAGQDVTVGNTSPRVNSVSTKVCTEGVTADIASKCETHPCDQTTVASIVDIGNNGQTHSYSRLPAFNCDEDKLLLIGGGNTIYDLIGNVIDSVPTTSRVMWSCYDPDLLWGIARGNTNTRDQFVSYDHVTNTETIYFDASVSSGPYTGSANCNVEIGDAEGAVKDDRCVVLHVECPDGKDQLVALDLTTVPATVTGVINTPQWQDHAGFDHTCQYILVSSSAAGQQYAVYDSGFNLQYGATNQATLGHGDFILLPDGSTGYVTVGNGNDDSYLDLATNTWSTIPSAGTGQSRHMSGLASKNCPGLYFGSDSAGGPTHLTQIDSDLSIVWELNLGNLGSGTSPFEAQTRGAISPCGNYAVIGSQGPQDQLITFDNSNCPELVQQECEYFYCEWEVVATDVNQPPTTTGGSKTTDQAAPILVSLSASDSDGTIAGYIIKTQPSNGSLSQNGNSVSIGVMIASSGLTYTPNAGFSGTDSFTWCAVDDDGAQSDTVVCDIQVSAIEPVCDVSLLVLTKTGQANGVMIFTATNPAGNGAIIVDGVTVVGGTTSAPLTGTPVDGKYCPTIECAT